jgi:hypothetical protein
MSPPRPSHICPQIDEKPFAKIDTFNAGGALGLG